MAQPTGRHPCDRKGCVFCGATNRKITKQHVWGNWLRKVLDVGDEKIEYRRGVVDRTGEHTHADTWETIPLDLQVRIVCDQCNQGWMEDLEYAVRPILTPLLQNESRELDADEQHTLVKWATLTVLMAQYAHPLEKRAIPPEQYRRFYGSGAIALPLGAQTWLGRYDGSDQWPTSYYHVAAHFSRGGPPPDFPNAYFVAFSVGYVAFFYIGHNIKDGPVYDPGDAIRPYLVPIWPITGRARWPPEGLLGKGGLEKVLTSVPFK